MFALHNIQNEARVRVKIALLKKTRFIVHFQLQLNGLAYKTRALDVRFNVNYFGRLLQTRQETQNENR